MKKIISIITVLFALLMLVSGCSDDEATTAKTDFTGTWSNSDKTMTADIAGDSITIMLSSEDFEGLYWKGTFPQGKSSLMSMADTEALGASMVGSMDKTKLFTYNDGQLQFEFTALGTTKVIEMDKQ